MEGSQLIWNQLNSDSDIDVMDTFSNTTQGFDIGFGVNLKNLIKQNIDSINSAMDKNNFESIESNLCNWCYYWKECDKKTGSNPSRYI